MSELQDAGRMLEAAERTAAADGLASADELLRGAARTLHERRFVVQREAETVAPRLPASAHVPHP